MRMRVLTTKLRVEIEKETRVFLESVDFQFEMRVAEVCSLVKNKGEISPYLCFLAVYPFCSYIKI